MPEGKSTAVFPPTDESTIDNKVVGIATRFIPRIYVEATNAPISPTTPPPNVITMSFLVKLFSAKKLTIAIKLSAFLFSSPCGRTHFTSSKSLARWSR